MIKQLIERKVQEYVKAYADKYNIEDEALLVAIRNSHYAYLLHMVNEEVQMLTIEHNCKVRGH